MGNSKKSALAWACIGMHQQYDLRKKELSPFFLRRPYSGTAAETKDSTQEKLHQFDYRK